MINFVLDARFFRGLQLVIAMCSIFTLGSSQALAQIASSDFVTTWKTDMGATNTPSSIDIDALGQYTLYYESIPAGISATLPGIVTGDVVVNFPQPGTYRVAIRPAGTDPFHNFSLSQTSRSKLLTIEQWGTAAWTSFYLAFIGAENLTAISASDAPDLSNVDDMSAAFNGCTSLASAPNMNNWDVSNVKFMAVMFYGTTVFNEPLNKWNVSNVQDMRTMFGLSPAFNQPLNNWDVSKATSMSFMFYECTSFNQSLGNWKLNPSVTLNNLLDNSGMDCSNYSNTLIKWAANPAVPSGRVFGADGKVFGSPAETARNFLTTTKGWKIVGDSFDPDCLVLPVTLVSFHAARVKNSSLLTWSTSEEMNSDHFKIQRSADARRWEEIGKLSSSGESVVLKNYRFEDAVPVNGIHYYRLKMVDRDGTFTYSSVRSVVFNGNEDLTVYPNPARDRLIIGNHESVKGIVIYNSAGVKAFEQENVGNQGLDIHKLEPGMYHVSVTRNDGTSKITSVVITE